ncbi:LOW QUALITY PROTEIN: nuclear envelope pore membrane protein POM 121 [Elgaria multicarinata webbii]|uniref:LOW QUALITY PROTEIN: nuclear envelope pore membrane protein POM 121 n=1 Tax=Elgaria multicarinata webbii TaxID=159646 RepID=UPI002FCCFB58
MLTPRRRYPIQQAQYTSLGTLPTICWDSYGRKNRLSAHNSGMIQSPVTVKIARPDSSLGRSPRLEQLASPMAPSPALNSTPDPCAKETVLSALRESRKRAVEEEEDDRSSPSAQENKRRRHGSSGSGQSAFEPLVANGAPASLVPKPGALKRSLLPSHCLDDGSSKRSRTSSLSSINSLAVGGIPSTLRNAIASSYSSSRGLAQLWKRSGPSTSPLSSPASSRSQTPERPNKKARYPNASLTEEEPHRSSTSTPMKADKEVQAEKTAEETPLQIAPSSPGARSSPGSGGKRKRRIQLLSVRRGNHFPLPPPPQLGYSVTSEDLDAEKAAALQWFNKVLEEKTDPSTSPPVETPPEPTALSFTPMSAAPAPVPLAVVTAAGSNVLLESLKKRQEEQSCCPGQAEPSAAAAVSSWPLVLPASPDVGSLAVPVGSPEAAQPLAPAPAPAPAPPSAAQPASGTSGVTVPSSSSSSSSSSELGQTPARPSSAPKPNILFGILTSPPASQPMTTALTTTAAAAAPAPAAPPPSTAPVFKPVFGSLAKAAEGLGFPVSGQGASAAAPSSEMAPPSGASPGVAPSSTFKPIFAGLPLPAAASSSPFGPRQPLLQPASAPSVPGFPGTTPSSTPATASGTTASASKLVFSFGSGLPAATAAPSSSSSSSSLTAAAAAATASPAAPAAAAATWPPQQPSLFGASPSASTAAGPLFPFGQLGGPSGPSPSPLASSAFGQAAATAASSESAPGTAAATTAATSGFSLFGGGSRLAPQASSAPSATAPPPLAFGSGSSAFSGGFGAASKPPPPYAAAGSQPVFEAGISEGLKPAAKAAAKAAGPGAFGTPFNFRGGSSSSSVVAQPAFGSATQTPFGEASPAVSFGTKSTAPQPAFGSATPPGFSFGGSAATTATSAGFGSSTQTASSGGGAQGGSMFGGPAPAPFAFGTASQPATAGSAFGAGATATASPMGTGAPPVAFSFGGGPSGTVGAATPLRGLLGQTPLGAQSQSSVFAFSIPGAPESKPAFGGAPTPTFGQSAPGPGGGAVGGCPLSFGAPAFGGAGPSFGPPAPNFSAPPGAPAPTFSIGAGSKMGARQRLQARRQHTRKK